MYTRCEKCERLYDDEGQWTICPHGPIEFPVDDYCPRCDTLKSVHGSCVHQDIAVETNPHSDLPLVQNGVGWAEPPEENLRRRLRTWDEVEKMKVSLAISTRIYGDGANDGVNDAQD